ncbi:MAG: hypothetical protein QW797_09800, partial [Thermoproteota archaeon]
KAGCPSYGQTSNWNSIQAYHDMMSAMSGKDVNPYVQASIRLSKTFKQDGFHRYEMMERVRFPRRTLKEVLQ